jgi:hypothetical protein
MPPLGSAYQLINIFDKTLLGHIERRPTTNVDIIVPTMAYRAIAPILSKKSPRLRLYPASNMIGGNRTKKKTSGDCPV